MRDGIVYVTEDRKFDGFFETMPVAENLHLGELSRFSNPLLARGGFPLAFLDHPGNQPVDDLVDLGAVACRSPGDVADVSDVIILCVTGSPQVEAILTGEAGILSRLRKGTVIVDCSTALPESTLRDGRRGPGGGWALPRCPHDTHRQTCGGGNAEPSG